MCKNIRCGIALNDPVLRINRFISVVMLSQASEKTDAFNQDISSWDVGGVENFKEVFAENDVFNQDISSWNVEKGTDFEKMFDRAPLFNQNLCAWLDLVSSDVDVRGMFRDTSCPNQTDPILPDGPMCHRCEP